MIANMGLSPLLVWPLGVGYLGIPIATSVAAWINTGLLAWFLVRRGHLTLDARLLARLPRFALAALVMAGVLWPAADALWPWLSGAVWQRVLSLLAVVIRRYGGLRGLLPAAARRLGRRDEGDDAPVPVGSRLRRDHSALTALAQMGLVLRRSSHRSLSASCHETHLFRYPALRRGYARQLSRRDPQLGAAPARGLSLRLLHGRSARDHGVAGSRPACRPDAPGHRRPARFGHRSEDFRSCSTSRPCRPMRSSPGSSIASSGSAG